MATMISNIKAKFSMESLKEYSVKSAGFALNTAASVVGAIGVSQILSGVNCEFNGESCLDVGVAGYDVSNFCENNLGISNNYSAIVGVVSLVAAKKLSDAGTKLVNMQFNRAVTVESPVKDQEKID